MRSEFKNGAPPVRRFNRRTTWVLCLLCGLSATTLQADEPVLNTTEAGMSTSSAMSDAGQNPLIAQGYADFQAGHADLALAKFKEALVLNDKEVDALLGSAMVYTELQRHNDAFEAYDNVVELQPQHAFAWNGRGLAAFNLEDFDEALNSFEHATADQPVNGFFYESLAWTYMCRGEFKRAAESAKTATLMYNRKGESAAYPLLISYFSYLESGDNDNAVKTLSYAMKNKPVRQWPAPILDYLSGQIDANDLISYVNDTAQETEAHTYIGMRLRAEAQPEEAAKHLLWVSRHGDPRVFEYTLARAMNLQHSVAVWQPGS
ncbi:tetratricopeptide repeat protein [Coraliomargarita parva]|uniref:tetratricopeptide repeat protein n=1 Tax=Coraliomargarita parva TaxID=3014050 RepID=UPI0022B5DEF4|nr:tetratricopeptide repeat protein [Coraliomargarita parva]